MNDVQLLARSFLAGAMDLRRHEGLLNRINVFPVVDADTGINMGQTLLSTVQWVRSQSQSAVEAFPGMAADYLLRDAKGNSGVIFGQFLSAFFRQFSVTGSLGLEPFRDCVREGKKAAYRSVTNPREGTLLTVMSALESGLTDRLCERTENEFTWADHQWLQQGLADSVAGTPNQLPVLKEAGVVDSGALGFYLFAAGFTLAIPARHSADGVAAIDHRISGADGAPLHQISDTIRPGFLQSTSSESDYRYCLNILVEREGEVDQADSSAFQELGASVDVARDDRLLKFHVHTNDKDATVGAAGRFGRVVNVAFDDMAEGLVKSMVNRGDLVREKVPVRVVGDSSMSIGTNQESELGIYKLENYVHAMGKMVTGDELDRDVLFARMREGNTFTTAKASPEDVNDFLGRMLSISEHLLFFAVGRPYSGTQDLVRKVVADHPQKERITVLDTHAASGQQGLACMATAKRAMAQSDVAELVRSAHCQIETSLEFLVIDDLKYLARSGRIGRGRIGRVKATFAGVLAIKPIVGHRKEGAQTYAKVRSHEAALKYILERVRTHEGEGMPLYLVEYTDNSDWAEVVAERLRVEVDGDCEILTAPLSPTSAVHMGPGTWGVAMTRM